MSSAGIGIVWAWCGSDQVSRDAWADWDVERQAWVLGAVFDAGFCYRCACERSLEEQPLVDSAISVVT